METKKFKLFNIIENIEVFNKLDKIDNNVFYLVLDKLASEQNEKYILFKGRQCISNVLRPGTANYLGGLLSGEYIDIDTEGDVVVKKANTLAISAKIGNANFDGSTNITFNDMGVATLEDFKILKESSNLTSKGAISFINEIYTNNNIINYTNLFNEVINNKLYSKPYLFIANFKKLKDNVSIAPLITASNIPSSITSLDSDILMEYYPIKSTLNTNAYPAMRHFIKLNEVDNFGSYNCIQRLNVTATTATWDTGIKTNPILITSTGGMVQNSQLLRNYAGPDATAFGNNTKAYGRTSHAEGLDTITGKESMPEKGESSHAEGTSTQAIGNCSHAEGLASQAVGNRSHAEGSSSQAVGESSHAEGTSTRAISNYSHAEGIGNTVGSSEDLDMGYSGAIGAHVGGMYCLVRSPASFAHGKNLIIPEHLSSEISPVAFGSFNNATKFNDVDNTVFMIGNGHSEASRNNSCRITNNGLIFATTYNSSGADVAELYEWKDGNINNETRLGLFVTVDGRKISIAQPGDYILGAISSNPCVIGNEPDEWKDKYLKDVFENIIMEEVEVDKYGMVEKEVQILDAVDNDGNPIYKKMKVYSTTGEKEKKMIRKLNPEYDITKQYEIRSNRPEWSYVGIKGQIIMVDDGTCIVNGFCKPDIGGIATRANTFNGYRVLERLDDTHIRIVMETIREFD